MKQAQKQKPRTYNGKKTRDEIQYLQDLRRSNASAPHRNKSKYTRKRKHAGKGWDE